MMIWWLAMAWSSVGMRAGATPIGAGCRALLGLTIERIEGDRVTFRRAGAVGPRGLLATAELEPAAETLAYARQQGVFYWGHAIGVQPSLEAARVHDRATTGLNQILYVIAPGASTDGLDNTVTVDADQLGAVELDRRRTHVRARWRDLLGGTAPRLVYFAEPEFDSARHDYGPAHLGVRPLLFKGTTDAVPRETVGIDPEAAARLIRAEHMQFVDKDPRGRMFYQWGWFFPRIRAVLTAERLMSQTARGGLVFDTTKNALKLAEDLVARGYTFTVNTDFREVLTHARGVMHGRGALAPGEPPIANSWLRDETMFRSTLDQFAADQAFSFELRDPAGALRAATIGAFGRGQHVMTDTSFALAEDKRERMAFLKLIGVASTLWLAEEGYPEVDKQVVTGFSAELKAVYEPGRRVLEAGLRPPPPRRSLKRTWRPPPWTRGVDGARVYPHYGRLSTQRTGS